MKCDWAHWRQNVLSWPFTERTIPRTVSNSFSLFVVDVIYLFPFHQTQSDSNWMWIGHVMQRNCEYQPFALMSHSTLNWISMPRLTTDAVYSNFSIFLSVLWLKTECGFDTFKKKNCSGVCSLESRFLLSVQVVKCSRHHRRQLGCLISIHFGALRAVFVFDGLRVPISIGKFLEHVLFIQQKMKGQYYDCSWQPDDVYAYVLQKSIQTNEICARMWERIEAFGYLNECMHIQRDEHKSLKFIESSPTVSNECARDGDVNSCSKIDNNDVSHVCCAVRWKFQREISASQRVLTVLSCLAHVIRQITAIKMQNEDIVEERHGRRFCSD